MTARSAQPSQGKRSEGAGRMDAHGMGQGWQASDVAPETRKRRSGVRNERSEADVTESRAKVPNQGWCGSGTGMCKLAIAAEDPYEAPRQGRDAALGAQGWARVALEQKTRSSV